MRTKRSSVVIELQSEKPLHKWWIYEIQAPCCLIHIDLARSARGSKDLRFGSRPQEPFSDLF
jgi:hypothetical protein